MRKVNNYCSAVVALKKVVRDEETTKSDTWRKKNPTHYIDNFTASLD